MSNAPRNIDALNVPDGVVHITQDGLTNLNATVGYTDAQGDQITTGNDTIVLDSSVGVGGTRTIVNAGAGNDTVRGEDATRASIIGGAGSDTIYGGTGGNTSEINEIATGGQAWLNGPTGVLLDGENDYNVVHAGNGLNNIVGEGGHDTIYGGSNTDLIMGYGKTGSTTIFGGAGEDLIVADAQNIRQVSTPVEQGEELPLSLFEAYLNGTVAQGAQVDGGSGDDIIFGSGGNDTINGGAGVNGESDNDFLVGGDGADTFIWTGANRGTDVIVDFGRGNAEGALGNGIQTDNDFVDLSAIFNEDTLAAYNSTYGTSFSTPLDAMNHNLQLAENQITDHRTNYYPEALTGGVDYGVHFSSSGRAISFNGTDGSGPKLIFNGLTRDLLSEETNVSDVPVPDGIVHITQNGLMNLNATVGYTDAQGDQITTGNDTIVLDSSVGVGGTSTIVNAGAGNDTVRGEDATRASIIGGAGSDTIYGGTGGNTSEINEIGTGGQAWLNGPTGVLLDGENDYNVVHAGNGLNNIIGEGGHDTIYGGSSTDVIMGYGKTGSTTIFGGAGEDIIVADAQNIRQVSTPVEQGEELPLSLFEAYLNGTVAQGAQVDGGSGDDIIFGSGGNDTINGGAGVNGESDNDFLVGGDGADTFIWTGANRGTDVIADFGRGNAEGALGNGIQTDNDFVDLSAIFNEDTLAAYNSTYGTSFSTPLDAMNHNLQLAENQITDHHTNYYPEVLTEGVDYGVHFSSSGRAISFNGTDGSGPKLIFNGLTRDLLSEETNVLCFMAGTLVSTENGEKMVQELGFGDVLKTVNGGTTKVLWIGKRTVRRDRLKATDYPVCIRTGALGVNIPHQDLYVSADHGMIIDGMVINARALINGGSIAYVADNEIPEVFTYYHIETLNHDEILANGAASETFVDYVGRSAFDNYVEYLDNFEVDRIIPEMKRMRISASKHLTPTVKALIGIQDYDLETELGEYLDKMFA